MVAAHQHRNTHAHQRQLQKPLLLAANRACMFNGVSVLRSAAAHSCWTLSTELAAVFISTRSAHSVRSLSGTSHRRQLRPLHWSSSTASENWAETSNFAFSSRSAASRSLFQPTQSRFQRVCRMSGLQQDSEAAAAAGTSAAPEAAPPAVSEIVLNRDDFSTVIEVLAVKVPAKKTR
jgi:hypothetical protein